MPFITRNFALAAAIALLPFCDTQLLVPGSVPDAASTGVIPKSTVKILVCGDSISQGQEGDFTWRYRLWEWFRSNAQQSAASSSVSSSSSSSSIIPVGGSSTSTSTSKPIGHFSPSLQYVGPFNGTLPAGSLSSLDASNPQTWGPYHPDVDPAFSPGNGSSHFAVYGRPAWLDIDKIRGQVETYRPDMVLLHLGFNDFGWWSNTAENLIESMQKLVFNARLGRRDVTILIADVSHRLLVTGRDDVPITTRAYNKMLWEKVDEWSTLESPVVVVRVSEEYACHVEACPAGIDGLHPNALGDFQIARAYTKVLHEQFLIGSAPLVVPRLEDIPGMKAGGIHTLTNSPVGIFLGILLLCLIIVVARRPRWLRSVRAGGAKYERLPTTRERSEF